jgi:hypothetical protein
MFTKMLQTALDSGKDIIVETKYYCDGVKGKVLDFDGEYFTLFHNGTGGGMLWAFRVEDVAYCGLLIDVPTALHDLSYPLIDPSQALIESQQSVFP